MSGNLPPDGSTAAGSTGVLQPPHVLVGLGLGGGLVLSNPANGSTVAGILAGGLESSNNTAYGAGALAAIANTSGGNTAIGAEALAALNGVNGSNTAVGVGAGNHLTTGGNNVIVGFQAGQTLTTGGKNTLIGRSAGSALPEGAENTLVIAAGLNTLIEGVGSPGRKLGLFGVAPVERAAPIASPAETLAALKTAVDAIRNALKGIGITE